MWMGHDLIVTVVDIYTAKAALSELVEQSERGEDVVITRDGQPVARIIALRSSGRRRRGQWMGEVRMSDDFDAPLPVTLPDRFRFPFPVPGSRSPVDVRKRDRV